MLLADVHVTCISQHVEDRDSLTISPADVPRPLRLSDLYGRPMLEMQAEQKYLGNEEQRGEKPSRAPIETPGPVPWVNSL